MSGKKITRADIAEAAEKYKNWGKWGADDEVGTLNYVGVEEIINAAKLVKKGKVISLALNFDYKGSDFGRTAFKHFVFGSGAFKPPLYAFNLAYFFLTSL